jgi:citrate synthase
MTDKPSSKEWRTSIAEATADGVQVRGYDVVSQLIGKIDFGEMVYLLLKGELPRGNEGKMINALFVSCAEHGISPSSTVSRFIQSAGVPIQVGVAAGVMMFGDIHGGAGQEFSRNIQDLVRQSKENQLSADSIAEEFVRTHKRLDGFGHPQHPGGDPRTPVLFQLARDYSIAGEHVAMTEALERALEKRARRRIAANIDAALGAISADMGFDWRVARAFIVVPRTAGLFAHCLEEMSREPGWRQITLDKIEYDGPGPRTR